MVTQVDSLMTRLNSGQGTAGKLLRDDSLYSNLVTVTARADSLVGSLRNGNGTASRFLSDTTLYNQMVEAVGHLNEILADIKKNPKRYTKGAIKIF
jgi:phospholipid/cholesterol/gamma-HCH transport system substrate-binding protein